MKFGFFESWIYLIWNSISNNWYSILINGNIKDLFHSTRELKQGDSLSPSLFIIGAEVLTRLLNNMISNLFRGFSMHKNGPQITHIAYADDVMIFTARSITSLNLIMHQLWNYERCSGQSINYGKSYSLVACNADSSYIAEIKTITGFKHIEFPIT